MSTSMRAFALWGTNLGKDKKSVALGPSSRSIDSSVSRPESIKHGSSRILFERAAEKVPAIGGCTDIFLPHSEFLLPPEVVLFEPSAEEIHEGSASSSKQGKLATRQIFLNTPLLEHEKAALKALHVALEEEGLVTPAGDGVFPAYFSLHALRVLQYRMFNVKSTIKLFRTFLNERVKRLPIQEAHVLDDLRRGFVYWHGRDRKCRPCLVIRMENLQAIKGNKERAVRLMIFTLEYAIRYAMVPGRVENWVVILDLLNVSKIVSMKQIFSLISTAKAIGTTLESVYCVRMVWMKIVNVPTSMKRPIESVIPAEKKKKIQFVVAGQIWESLRDFMEPHQVEQRFGGTAPNLKPEETYPFRFFPNASRAADDSPAYDVSSSLHQFTSRSMHEGALWDDSTEYAKARWIAASRSTSLTPVSAAALGKLLCTEVEPCTDMSRWMELVCPEEAKRRKSLGQRTRELELQLESEKLTRWQEQEEERRIKSIDAPPDLDAGQPSEIPIKSFSAFPGVAASGFHIFCCASVPVDD